MANLDVIGNIIKKRSENLSDQEITSQLTSSGTSQADVSDALSAIEDDVLLTIDTIRILTPIAPVTYRLGWKRIEKETKILGGLFKSTVEVGIRTIDKVNITKNIIYGTIRIMHSGRSQISIDKISRSDAELVRQLYAEVIEAQRKSIINITQD